MKLNRVLPMTGIVLGCLCCFAGYGRATTTEGFKSGLRPPPPAVQSPSAINITGPRRGIDKVGHIENSEKANQPQVAMQLQFGLNSAGLQSEAVAELDRLAGALEDPEFHSYKYILEGHTCDLGSATHNLELSKRRAYAVADYLTSHTSLSPNQFEVNWYGESVPLVVNRDENARRQNRRVVIKNTMKNAEVALQGRQATLEITRYHNGETEILSDGDILVSRSPYAVSFKTATKPYVYICQQDAEGKTDLIFPQPKFSQMTNPITPGKTYRIPGEHSNGFILDNTIGTEQFAMLALDAPVTDPDSACSTVFQSNNTVAARSTGTKRGIGGTAFIADNEPPPAADDSLRLCEVVAGGQTRGIAPAFITRGIQGVAGIDSPPQAAAKVQGADGSCQGFYLQRFINHQ